MPNSNQDWWLVVEDHEDELMLMRRACARALQPCPILEWQIDGLAAVEFFGRCETVPQLIVSDLKMPRMDGLEFLAWANQQPRLQQTPFVILSNSGRAEDRRRAMELGADGYWVKPPQVGDFDRIFQEMAALALAGKRA